MSRLTGLPRRLVEKGFINPEKIDDIIKLSVEEKISFTSAVVKSKLVDARSVAALASEEFGLPLLDLSLIHI